MLSDPLAGSRPLFGEKQMADQKDMSVFDSGDVNPYNKFFTGISYLKMLSTEQVRARVPQPLAYPPRDAGRRSDSARDRGPRLVSGVG